MRLARFIDGKKFMWDGAEYREKAEARSVMEGYTKDGFETRMIQEEDQFYLFTRRLVSPVKTGS